MHVFFRFLEKKRPYFVHANTRGFENSHVRLTISWWNPVHIFLYLCLKFATHDLILGRRGLEIRGNGFGSSISAGLLPGLFHRHCHHSLAGKLLLHFMSFSNFLQAPTLYDDAKPIHTHTRPTSFNTTSGGTGHWSNDYLEKQLFSSVSISFERILWYVNEYWILLDLATPIWRCI